MKGYSFYLLFVFVAGANFKCVAQTLNGMGNNMKNLKLGSANTQFLRISAPKYDDGYSSPRMHNLPNPRNVSNEIAVQNYPKYDDALSDFFWLFGQFIDHDIVLNRGNSGETIQINTPIGDPFFDPRGTGKSKIQISRSKVYGADSVRQHENETTAFLDASIIYGVNSDRLNWLRTDNGKLKSSNGNNLPYNTQSGAFEDEIDFSAPFMELSPVNRPEKYYVSGDIRANEHPGLALMHTLFLREHNRIADSLKVSNPKLGSDSIFFAARKFVIGYIQSITYYEWLPLLGIDLRYAGYDEDINPSIGSEFSTTAFRFGHSLVNEQILRLDVNGDEWHFGSIDLKNSFFSTIEILEEGGIAPIIRGLKAQKQQRLDNEMVGSLRNFLFGPPGSGGMDLSVINILRGRERGIPDLNSIRRSLNLPEYNDFYEMTGNSSLAGSFNKLYDIHNVDPWIAMLAERKADNSILGETMMYIIEDQFSRLIQGDRFWFENDDFFSESQKEKIKSTKLSNIIRRNTSVKEIDDVFVVDELITAIEYDLNDQIKEYTVSAFPNPFFERINLEVKSNKEWFGKVVMNSLEGSLVLEENIHVEKGDNHFELIPGFVEGSAFILRIISNDKTEILKVVKK